MRARLLSSVLILAAWTAATSASAQTARPDSATTAVVQVRNSCLLTPGNATQDDYGPTAGEAVPAALVALGVGMAGDIVKIGVTLFADALTHASQERSFSASGITSFDFYEFARASGAGGISAPASMAPRIVPEGGLCLIIAVENPLARGDAVPADPATALAAEPGLRMDQISRWTLNGLPARPVVYVEAELQHRPDGFRVRPVLVWQGGPLPGAQNRRQATELHVSFGTPALAADQAAIGAPFAIARIQLPALDPGNALLGAKALQSYSGPVMPLRPITGSAETAAQRLATLEASANQSAKDVELTQRAFETAALAAGNGARDTRLAADFARRDRDAAGAAQQRITQALSAARSRELGQSYGSTNVQARFVTIRDANAFGMAIADSLRARAPALGTAVTTALTPDTPEQAWTALDTTYVAATTAVQEKQAAYEAAVAEGDVGKTLTARLALTNAWAAANAAAAASGRSLPYPGII